VLRRGWPTNDKPLLESIDIWNIIEVLASVNSYAISEKKCGSQIAQIAQIAQINTEASRLCQLPKANGQKLFASR